MFFGATSSFGGGGASSLRIFMSFGTTGAAAGGGFGLSITGAGGGGGGGSLTTVSTKVRSTFFSWMICFVAVPIVTAAMATRTYNSDELNRAASQCWGPWPELP